jgi:hypothetical protein
MVTKISLLWKILDSNACRESLGQKYLKFLFILEPVLGYWVLKQVEIIQTIFPKSLLCFVLHLNSNL